MILVRLMVRPHLLEQIFECIEPYELDALMVRQVRGLKADSRQSNLSLTPEVAGFSGMMHAELDFFIDEDSCESLLESLRSKVACGSSDDCRIFCLHCAVIDPVKSVPMAQKLKY
jgi:nitrogen regulatory protein PII